ncbi:MAG: hypothetical protein F4W90_06480 [Gammaproteobacteria bacterium]|nr:hypothetical protein [Gammaproteobacteria bacterium]
MQKARAFVLLATVSCLAFATVAFADGGTTWLPAPGTGSVTVSYVSQSADNMWVGENGPNPIPFQGLEQSTFLVNGTYGLTDAVALDVSVGRSEVSPTHGRPIPLSTDGITDTEAGVTWRFSDEVVTGNPSMAVRMGVILAGNYDTGGFGPAESGIMGDASRVGAGPTAIGDGANGFELSGIIGKVFNGQFALAAEAGVRTRAGEVPTETFINLDAHVFVRDNIVLSGQYHIQSSSGDLDIGPPPSPGKHGTNWQKFPFVAEDVNRLSIGGTLLLDQVNIGLHWFNVLDGRNTAEFKALGGTLTYNFGQ